MDLNRRTFLKLMGATGAGAALPGCEREVHNLVPLMLPDDEQIPGVASWYASFCRECEAGCGTLVRVMDGRAKKIEGNPEHPVNEGKLCARGHGALQVLYNPDRVRGPLLRDGARGEGRFTPISWQEGLDRWVQQLDAHPGRAAMITAPVGGTLGELFVRFMRGLAGVLLPYEPLGQGALRAAMRGLFAMDALPHHDIGATDYVLSFGAPVLEHWLSPVASGVAYGRMRQGRPHVRGRFVQIEPRLSLTAANADRWVPVRPGTEGLLAIAIGHVLLDEGRVALSGRDRERFERLYHGYSLKRMAQETDVAVEQIVRLAREFSNSALPLAIGGGDAADHTNGVPALMAIYGLNVLAGRIGQPGGLKFVRPAHRGSAPSPVGENALVALTEQVRRGERKVLHLHGVNPLYTMPPATGIQHLFGDAEFIVSFNSFLDESSTMADLILPDHVGLESWGDHPHVEAVATPTVTLGQPVVQPLYDTRQTGDVLLQAAHRLGGVLAEQLPWPDMASMLKAEWTAFMKERGRDGDAMMQQGRDEAWVEAVRLGGWWSERGVPIDPPNITPPLAYEQPAFDGAEADYPFYLAPFKSIGLHDGRGANVPWLQELPDTLTTAVWGSWVEMNPTTARRLGIRPGEVVRVVSPYGSIEAQMVPAPGNRPDVIAMPLGQGHTAYGRYAQGRGVNPIALLGPAMEPRSGTLATGGTRVRIERTERTGSLVMMDVRGQTTRGNMLQIERHGKPPI